MFRSTGRETIDDAQTARRVAAHARGTLIAQITDTHLGFAAGGVEEPNRRRLDALVAQIAELDRRPDALLVTGDLVEHGDEASYRALRDALAPLEVSVHLCLGNHDARGAFRRVFPEVATDADGFVQYVAAVGLLRLIVLDTLDEGRHGGGFCARRADWLAARLAEDRTRPTLIVLHHPPFDTGIPWMTTDPDEPWVARLHAALSGAGNVVGLVAGHIHRPIVTGWAGRPVIVCPSAAPQVALRLARVDPAAPDARPMIVDNPPGLALHWWNGAGLVTHFADPPGVPVLARFDAGMAGGVAAMIGERPA